MKWAAIEVSTETVIGNGWNASELTAILAGMKQSAPPEAFAGMLKMTEQATPPATWETVRRALC